MLHDLPWGRLGLTVCYDLRFPALYRALAEAGASFLAIPSAFTRQTGEAHWHVLMRARAIENGCFVFAAAQGGKHENGRETFGHSLVVDPWGRILAEGGTEPGVVMAEIDPAEVAAARARVPSLQHGRRFEVVEPMAEPTHLRAVGGRHDPLFARSARSEHEFEIWFKNSADYDKQPKRGLVTCPACGSAKVEKAMMAPSLGRGTRKGASRADGGDRAAPEAAASRRDQDAGRDDVAAGARVPHQAEGIARPPHQECRQRRQENSPRKRARCITARIEHRSIYGEASPQDAKELLDEGIEFHPLPVLPDERN